MERNRSVNWDTELAKRLYDEGMSDRQIGIRVSISPQCIAKWRKQNGLPSNYERTARRKSAAPALDPAEVSPARPFPPYPEDVCLPPVYLILKDIAESVPDWASAEVQAAAADYAAAIVRTAVLKQISSRAKESAVIP